MKLSTLATLALAAVPIGCAGGNIKASLSGLTSGISFEYNSAPTENNHRAAIGRPEATTDSATIREALLKEIRRQLGLDSDVEVPAPRDDGRSLLDVAIPNARDIINGANVGRFVRRAGKPEQRPSAPSVPPPPLVVKIACSEYAGSGCCLTDSVEDAKAEALRTVSQDWRATLCKDAVVVGDDGRQYLMPDKSCAISRPEVIAEAVSLPVPINGTCVLPQACIAAVSSPIELTREQVEQISQREQGEHARQCQARARQLLGMSGLACGSGGFEEEKSPEKVRDCMKWLFRSKLSDAKGNQCEPDTVKDILPSDITPPPLIIP